MKIPIQLNKLQRVSNYLGLKMHKVKTMQDFYDSNDEFTKAKIYKYLGQTNQRTEYMRETSRFELLWVGKRNFQGRKMPIFT